MYRSALILPLALLSIFFTSSTPMVHAQVSDQEALSRRRAEAVALFRDGNHKEALPLFEALALNPANDTTAASNDLRNLIACYQQLNRVNEIDEVREQIAERQQENWRMLSYLGINYSQGVHYGFMISGKFERGSHRGGGKQYSSFYRDRIRAMQLMYQAIKLLPDRSAREHELSTLYFEFARIIQRSADWGNDVWRLQHLSDLESLPDYDEMNYGWSLAHTRGAPTTSEGKPVFYEIPASFERAKSDGERWRWVLEQVGVVQPSRKSQADLHYADFLRSQVGVQSMVNYYYYLHRPLEEDPPQTFALHLLSDNETVARIASGIKRFELPAEHNFIKIYRRISKRENDSYAANALKSLAEVLENRRQYPRALAVWQELVERFGSRWDSKDRIKQIKGNFGKFEPVMSQPAGKGATVEYTFRNGRNVKFRAQRIDIKTLLADIKEYLRGNPERIEWQKINLHDIGHRIIYRDEERYLTEQVASWSERLEPRPDHFDKRITVQTPLKRAGAYMLTAEMEDGNVNRIVIWVQDTILVKKPLSEGAFYFVADAQTGKPVAGATLEFFGYRQEYKGKGYLRGTRYQTLTRNFAEKSSTLGQVIPDSKLQEKGFQWIVTATDPSGRFAFHGFHPVWSSKYYDSDFNQVKSLAITDRPVYRPGQEVKFKFWVRRARYDLDDTSEFADRKFTVSVYNPRGDSVFEEAFETDSFGGLDGTFTLEEEAQLGVYRIVTSYGEGNFRVEEYKKPEFEVSIKSPEKPVALGETISAEIEAKYYFGAPVTDATVRYKVMRYDHDVRWFPHSPWDWLYGGGYWWFAYDYDWYPGWWKWGCRSPIWSWWHRPTPPPEIVLENEVKIGADGKVLVDIDTALIKEIQGDKDHRFEITAEVVDKSRRTIVGKGETIASRDPFKVYTWVDRGYYRSGETIKAQFYAQTADGTPVKGRGELVLKRIGFEKGKPTETVQERWSINTESDGRARMQIKASKKGQYRLSYNLTDQEGKTREGAYIFNVIGEGASTDSYRFNDLELIPDRREYAPGDEIDLLVNTHASDSTVLLFTRPVNSVYLEPEVLTTDGKSLVKKIAVTRKDIPNFFVEAITVRNGKIHRELRQIVVPPEDRVADVRLETEQVTYKPGQEAEVKLKLTTLDGKPFVGSTVVSVYDKSVEYISGGSNVPSLKEFFWKHRRRHRPVRESNGERWSQNVRPDHEHSMRPIGVFGKSVASEPSLRELKKSAGHKGRSSRSRSLGLSVVGGSRLNAVAKMEVAEGMVADALAPAAASGAFVEDEQAGAGAAGANLVEPSVRSEFADTAHWVAAVETDSDGRASVSFDLPENLTTWMVRAWSLGHGTRVGQGTAEVVTTKDLLVRLQAPRFFVEKDEVVLSANVHNYLAESKDIEAQIEFEGGTLELMDRGAQRIQVAPGEDKRVDWRVRVLREGDAIVRVKALSDQESDAMQMEFPVFVHGIAKTESFSGAIYRTQDATTINLNVPKDRREEDSLLEVRFSPSIATAMVDALPYLVSYPYGCTEQTLSRFLPTVITQGILKRLGVNLAEIQKKRTNLNPQEIGDPKTRATGWRQWSHNPVFDEGEVERMVKVGLARLTEMQLSDGGWGWFSGYGERSSAHTTAYVVHGLQMALQNGLAVVPGVLGRGVSWLKEYEQKELRKLRNAETKTRPYKNFAGNMDAFVHMVLVDADHHDREMSDFLYRDRTKLSVYAKAMFGMALLKTSQEERLQMIMRNIEQVLVEDEENQTAYLNLPSGSHWWAWYGSEYEAHAYYLKLLAAKDPKGRIASRLAKYLINNRKNATYWKSTRDTALVIEALGDYLKASGEISPDMTIELLIDGERKREVRVTSENLFTFDNVFLLEGRDVTGGKHQIEVRRKGEGVVYLNAYLTYFSLEDPIRRAGLEVKVDRKYYKLSRRAQERLAPGSHGQLLTQKVEKYDRTEIEDLDTIQSGDLVEIELEINSKNDYEYLVFEDMKASGFEPVEVQSGYNGNEMGAYVEFRDEKVNFFVKHLARGKHSVSYRMRAETPGRFSALPTRGYGMYAPELRANSDELKISVD